jgi:hypothetical protein
MVRKKDFIVIGLISILLSMTGFILDLNERGQDIKSTIFEILMMTVLIYGIISILYFPIKLLTINWGKRKS